MNNQPIILDPGESIDLVVDGCIVRVAHAVLSGAGDVSALHLFGATCGLASDGPGLYIIEPHNQAAKENQS